MSDAKSEEQIAKEREAVAAMKNAQANMGKALDRIATLEGALRGAIDALGRARGYISPAVYTYPNNASRDETCHAAIDRWIADARAKLGVPA